MGDSSVLVVDSIARRRAEGEIRLAVFYILAQPDLRHTAHQVIQHFDPGVKRRIQGRTNPRYQEWIYRVQRAREELSFQLGLDFEERRHGRSIEYVVREGPALR